MAVPLNPAPKPFHTGAANAPLDLAKPADWLADVRFIAADMPQLPRAATRVVVQTAPLHLIVIVVS